MRRRLAIFSVIGATLAVLAVGGIGVVSAAGQEPPNQKVTLCHATAAENNPYVVIEVDENSIANVILGENGHATHTGPIFPDTAGDPPKWGDIIPAFDIGENHFAGLNNTTEGLAILENDCQIPEAPPETTPETTPETKPPVTAPKAPPTPPAAPSAPRAVTAAPVFTG